MTKEDEAEEICGMQNGMVNAHRYLVGKHDGERTFGR
jgi:hypothetical protein